MYEQIAHCFPYSDSYMYEQIAHCFPYSDSYMYEQIARDDSITKTRLYNFDPLKPHFYIVKLGLQGYTLFFLFLFKT